MDYLYEQLDQGDVLDVAFADIHTSQGSTGFPATTYEMESTGSMSD